MEHGEDLMAQHGAEQAQTGTQAIDRAAEMLALVVQSTHPQTFTSLQEQTGFAKATTSRLLHALERHRLLRRGDDGTFRPGQLFAQYAATHDVANELIEAAQPLLDRLGELTGETVNMALLRGQTVVHIAQVQSRYVLGATNWVGQDAPPHCSADGKVYLAHGRLPPPTGRLARRTPQTITRRSTLRAELAEIRRRGYATNRDEYERGLVAVAAPIISADGAVIATVSLSGAGVRIDEERLHALGRLLCSEIAAWSADPDNRPTAREGATSS